MKKTAAILLLLCVLVSAIPFAASAEYPEEAFDYVRGRLYVSSSSINVSAYSLSGAALAELMEDIFYNCPELFYVSLSYSYTYNSEKVLLLKPTYTMSGTTLSTARAFYSSGLSRICALIPSGLSDEQKALFLHDYLCVSYEYDTDYKSVSAYSLLSTGKGVCMAYTLLYDALLSECGIESRAVSSDSLNHMWNEVLINGEYYHVDVTWDDPVTDMPGRACHDFFLMSDSAISATSHGSDYSADVSAGSTVYDGHSWHESEHQFGFSGGSTYYLSGSEIMLVSLSSGSESSVFTVEGIWPVWGSQTGYWSGCFSGFGSIGRMLIFNTRDKIYAYDPLTDDADVICSPDVTNGYVYSLFTVGGTVKYLVSVSPALSDYTVGEMTASFADPIIGDLDGDGAFDSTDLIMACQADAGLIVLTSAQRLYADVDGSGAFDSADLILMCQMDAQIISEWPVTSGGS